MDIYILKVASSDRYESQGLAAVCLSFGKAKKMLKEWLDEEAGHKGRLEDIKTTYEITDEPHYKSGYAALWNESGAWLECTIEKGWTDDWLNF